jgi:CHAT domain-containing protein/tetratricopeptide (TPR) repeat protein
MNFDILADKVQLTSRRCRGFACWRWLFLLLCSSGFYFSCTAASAQERSATEERQAELNRKVALANRHWSKAEYDDALIAQGEAAAIAEEIFGLEVVHIDDYVDTIDYVHTIEVVTRHAEWLTASGKWDDAEKAWQKLATLADALPRYEQWRAIDARLGQANVAKLKSLSPAQQAEYLNLRVLNESLRKLAYDARPQRRQALQNKLDVLIAALGRDTEQVASAMLELGNAWLGDKSSTDYEPVKVNELLTQSLEIRERILGRLHPKTLESAIALCSYALIARDRDQVTAYHAAALEMQKEQWINRMQRRVEQFADEPKEPDWRQEGTVNQDGTVKQEGNVKWQAGSVTIAPGNSLETHISAGPVADFDLTLAFAAFKTDGTAAVDIDIFMGPAGWIRVTLRRQRRQSDYRSLVEIHDMIDELKEGRVVPLSYRKVRSVLSEGDLASGHWKIRVRYGSVEVYQGDSLVVRGYVDKEPPPVPDEITLSLAPILKDRHLPHLQRRFREIYGSVDDYEVANKHSDLCGDLPPRPSYMKISPTGLPLTWGGFSLVSTAPPAELNEDEKVEMVKAKFQTRYFLEAPVVGESEGELGMAIFNPQDMTQDRMELSSGHRGESSRQNVAAIVGVRHPYYANTLELIALEAESIADWAWGELLRENACQILRETVGAYHPDYAAALLRLAATHNSGGQFTKAAGRFREAADVFFATEGSDSARAAKSLSDAIRAYTQGGRFAEAGQLADQLQMNSAAANLDGATRAEILEASGEAYYARGDLDAAVRAYEQALAVDNPADQSLPNSAMVARSKQQFGTRFADEFGLTIATLRSESLRDKPPTIVFHRRVALRRGVRLARIHIARGDPDAARRYHQSLLAVAPYIKADAEREEALFMNSFWVLDDMILSLVEWAEVSLALGELKLAEAMLEIAGQRTRAQETENNQQRLIVHAGLNELLGAQDEALRRYVIAAELARELYGVGSPRHIDAVNALAGYHWRQNDREQAIALFEHAVKSWVDFMTGALLTLPESQALALLEQHRPPVGQMLSALGHDPRSAARAYDAVWLTKGQITMLLAERQRFRKELGDDRLLQGLESVRQRLARLALSQPGEEQEEERIAELAAATELKERLEIELAEKSATYRRSRASVAETPADLVRRLPAATAVVDFRESQRFVPRQLSPDAFDQNGLLDLRLWDTVQRHYEAFVLRSADKGADAEMVWIDLGPADPIDEAIMAWRLELLGGDPEHKSGEQTVPDGKLQAAWLKTHLWEPLAPHLEGAETVLLLPDQRLGFLPWNALPGRESGRYLIEDFALATAPSARWLLQTLAAPVAQGEGLLLLAAVDYDHQTSVETSSPTSTLAARTTEPTGNSLRFGAQNAWHALPGTAAEAREIMQLWQGKTPVLLGGAEANETAVRRDSTGIRYLHLATHGFFADEALRSWLNWDIAGQTVFGNTADGTLARRHPGLLTGVVLAGANANSSKEQSNLPDGILTAEEALGLDLAQTELVTLSACQTGLGATADGEGVFGLQRAFHLAGARTVAASLWRVDDDATRVLMVEFYRNLWERKLGRLESLRQAQIALLRRYDSVSGTLRGVGGVTTIKPSSGSVPPALWAPFVLSGDWR